MYHVQVHTLKKLLLFQILRYRHQVQRKASIVGPEAVGAIPYTGQIRFKMTQSLIREYFLYFANSDTYLNQIDRMKTGNCIQHYGPTHLKEVYIPIPPIEEQERIIKQLSSLLSSLYEIEESITM